MGRKSKLTEAQWETIRKRLIDGESASSLATEYGVNRAAVSRKLGENFATVKIVAKQLYTAETALKALPLAQQISAITLAQQLVAISGHLAGAASFGAATAHRLSGIAHGKVQDIDDAKPLDEKSMESLKSVAVLTRMANDASEIGINLLKANKETVDDLNRPSANDDLNLSVTFGK